MPTSETSTESASQPRGDVQTRLQHMEQVLRDRAARLAARRAEDEGSGNTRTVLVCSLDESRFAVEVRFVVRTADRQRITLVPGAPREILGVTSFNGEICPVIDLGRVLGANSRAPARTTRVVFLKRDGQPVGMSVDRLIGTLDLDESEIAQPSPDFSLAGNSIVNGVTGDGVVLLSAQRLVALAPT